MAWSQKDFWKTTWQSVLISSCLEFWGRISISWGLKFTRETSLSHTYKTSLPPGLQITQKTMNQVTAFWSKATHVIASAPKCKYHLILSPSCPAPPWLHHFTVSLSLYFSFCIYRRRKAGRKGWQHIDFKEIKEIDSRKKAKLLHTTTHTRSRKIFKCIPNKWKPLSLKIVLISALVEKRVKRVSACIMLRIILSRCQKGMVLDLNNWWSTPTLWDGFRSE